MTDNRYAAKWIVVLVAMTLLCRGLQAEVAVTSGGTPLDQSQVESRAPAAPMMPKAPSHRVLQGKKYFSDATLRSSKPNRLGGKRKDFDVQTGNDSCFSLLRVDLSSLPRKPIKDAALMLYLRREKGQPLRVLGYPLNASWNEKTVTWRERRKGRPWEKPGAGGAYDMKRPPTLDVSYPAVYGRGWTPLKSPALTKQINAWIDGSKENNGLLFRYQRSKEQLPVSSKSFVPTDRVPAWQHPALIVSYDQPIDPKAYGYVSDSELAQLPLLRQLALLEPAARRCGHCGPAWEAKVAKLTRKIRQLKTADSTQNKKLSKQIRQLRRDLLTKEWPNQPIVLWAKSPWATLKSYEFPAASPIAQTVRLLREEYQEISIVATNTTDQPQSIHIDIEGLGDKGFPRRGLTLRSSYWVKGLTQLKTREAGATGKGLPPEDFDDALPRLAKDRELTLAPGEHRRIWLTVRTHGVKAGLYRLVVEFTEAKTSKALGQWPVTLKVLPVALKKDPNCAVHTYAYLNRRSTREHMAEAAADLKAHYENTFIFSYLPNPPIDDDGHIIGRADYEPLREMLRNIKDARELVFYLAEGKLPRFNKKLPWMSKEHKKALRFWLTNFVGVLREEGFGYDRFMMYPFDESYSNPVKGGRPELQALAEMADAIHEIDPKVRVFANPVTAHKKDDPLYEKLRGKIAAWSLHKLMLDPGDHTAYWPYNFSAADKHRVIEGFFRDEQRAGRPMWAFQICGRSKSRPINRFWRRWPWQIWHIDFTGIGLWAYNDIRGKSSWRDMGPDEKPDWAVIYEMRDAPADIPRDSNEALIPSRRWQAWREGIEDYFMLQQIVQRDPSRKAELKKLSRSILDDPDNPKRYEEAREKLIDLLLELELKS